MDNTKVVFEASLKEKIIAWLFIVPGFIYVSSLDKIGMAFLWRFGVFFVILIAFAEALFWERKRSFESIFFLICLLMVLVSFSFGIGSVWEDTTRFFFLHLFAVYWILVRSDCLAEGKTSHLFAWDGFNGLILMPFRNFGLGAKTIGKSISLGEKRSAKKIAASVGAIAIGLILFAIAMFFLKNSDANYEAFLDNLIIEFDFDFGSLIWRLIGGSIVGSYLFGLVDGSLRNREKVYSNGEKINQSLMRLNKIPNGVWIGLIVLFSGFYVIYFALQGSYMIDAFRMTLPEQFTFAEYARKGFGDMCAVMIINFILLWLSIRTSEKKSKPVMMFSLALVVESMIFALIASLKLLMYIEVYGFTPLRLRAAWLIVVLSFACICILISMFTEKKTAQVWFMGSAATLAILTLI